MKRRNWIGSQIDFGIIGGICLFLGIIIDYIHLTVIGSSCLIITIVINQSPPEIKK